ncbi:14551_t:CDS:1, partial [Gigaspora rosea]
PEPHLKEKKKRDRKNESINNEIYTDFNEENSITFPERKKVVVKPKGIEEQKPQIPTKKTQAHT